MPDAFDRIKNAGLMSHYKILRDQYISEGMQKGKAIDRAKKECLDAETEISLKKTRDLAMKPDPEVEKVEIVYAGEDAAYQPTQADFSWACCNVGESSIKAADAPSKFAFELAMRMRDRQLGKDVYKQALSMITPKSFVDDEAADIDHDDGRSLTRIAEKLKAAFENRPELRAS